MTVEIQTSNIKFGHEFPGGSVDVRQSDKDIEIGALSASISAEGLLQPILAMKRDDIFYVVDGNRRLKAIHALKLEVIDDSWLRIIDAETIEDAIAKGLAANVQRVPLHEVDRYQAFAALNLADTEIAKRFDIDVKTVRKALALGKLSPRVLESWRKGEMREDCAKAFAMQPDIGKQDMIFDRLKKTKMLGSPWDIKREIRGNQRMANEMLTFIGKAAYLKRGGAMLADLFAEVGDQPAVSDYELLVEIVKEVTAPQVEKITEAGWGWVEYDFEMPEFWAHDMTLVADAPEGERRRYGCVLTFKDKALTLIQGVSKVKPKPSTAAGASVERVEKKKINPMALSRSLEQRIDSWTAKATKRALHVVATDDKTDELTVVLAGAFYAMIDADRPNAMPDIVRRRLPEVRNHVDAAIMDAELGKSFDRKDYLGSAPIAVLLKAIEESFGKEAAAKLTGKPRSMIEKFALSNLPKTYLPPLMRTPTYAVKKISGSVVIPSDPRGRPKGGKKPATKRVAAKKAKARS